MSIPLPDEPERLDARLNARCTPRELSRLKQEADKAALSLSQYVRRRALGRVVLCRVELKLVAAVNRLTGMLKHVHLESGGAYSEVTAEAVRAAVALMKRIDQGVVSKSFANDRKNPE